MVNPFQAEFSHERKRRLADAIAALSIFIDENGRRSFARHIFRSYPNASQIEALIRDLPWSAGAETVASQFVNRLDGCQAAQGLTALSLLEEMLIPSDAHQLEPASQPSFEGQKIDGYLVGERLGKGGQAVVHRATRLVDQEKVALKFLLKQPGESQASSEILAGLLVKKLNEVALKKIDHDRVLQPLDKADLTQDGCLYYPLRLMKRELRDFMNENGPLPFERAAQIVHDLAEALQAAHYARITHQDLKPENILMDESDQVHIADWGLAGSLELRHSLASRLAAAGTMKYMAPEVFKKFYWIELGIEPQEASVDVRADLYSLGLILYELLTGVYAFGQHENNKDVLAARMAELNRIPQSPAAEVQGIPTELADLCQSCLHPDPNQRVQSAQELKESLVKFLPIGPAYLIRLLKNIEEKARLYSPLRGFERVQRATPTPVPRRLKAWQDNPHIALVRHHRRSLPDQHTPEQLRDYPDILTAFDGLKANGPARRAVLLGAPGSGKSTTLQRLAAELAESALKIESAPLPILVPLGNWTGNESLHVLIRAGAPELGSQIDLQQPERRLVLLLDGLNEVPTAKRTAKVQQVRALLEKLPNAVDLVVSCRLEDYAGELSLNLDTLTLQPLTPQRVRAAVHQWIANSSEPPEVAERFFWQLAGHPDLELLLAKWQTAASPAAPEEIEEQFWTVADPIECAAAYGVTTRSEDNLWREHVRNPRSLLKLAENPFMLTMLYNVWEESGELPANRGDLFQRFVMGLLSREKLLSANHATQERRPTAEGEQLLTGLKKMAWTMQKRRVEKGSGDDYGVMTVVKREEAVRLLGGEDELKRALDGTMLDGGEEIKFRHQLLQEYFTAVALEEQLGKLKESELWPAEKWWERSGWEETAVLLVGLSKDYEKAIRWLEEAQPEVAAKCLLESGLEWEQQERIKRELKWGERWRKRMEGPGKEEAPEGRAAVGRALGRLGLDNRKGVGLREDGVPEIVWVKIEGGKFKYQGDWDEIEDFEISKYLVTNVQWEAFLRAEDGYREDRWWEGFTEPKREPEKPAWSESNSPRERVSWWEAVAFSRWLQEKCKGERPERQIRLATEREWERAAGGKSGKMYPWGKDYREGYANVNETLRKAGRHYLGRTSAVGIYEEGKSEDGVLDLSGNLWEWCRNEYGNPRKTEVSGTGSRALRGGSWGAQVVFASAGFRDGHRPDYRNGYIGFRVLRSSPIR
jgi:serine/threonine protein kinase/formylglycine-generating enzyme required for sulfatase activity